MTASTIGAIWWKLLVVAACLVASVVVGSGLGVNAWFLGVFLIVLAAACAIAGVVLGCLALLARMRPTQR